MARRAETALGKAGCGFADAEEFEAEGCAPVVERRLLEPGLSVEARRDPVAGFGHVAGDPGVARFVGADEADGAEMAEVADVESGEDQDGPADAGGSILHIRGLMRGRVGLHGASLA